MASELEQTLGHRLRQLRVAQRLTQAELADRANVSLGALKHLETGAGSTTATLLKVVRALGQERWVTEGLAPAPAPFNPLDLLAARQGARDRQRVRHRTRSGR